MTTLVGRKKVLIFDDSPLVLELTQQALERAGYAVATAADLTAFELARNVIAPDLILVDVQMPEAFGDDVASTLRGMRGVRVPILLVSNLDDAQLERRTREAGGRRMDLQTRRAARARPPCERAPLVMDELVAKFLPRFAALAQSRLRAAMDAAVHGHHDRAEVTAHDLHSLAGEAGLLGLEGVIEAARTAEDAARRFGGSTSEEDTRAFVDCLKVLERAVTHAMSDNGDP